jgi:hypothetical protein
MRMTLRLQISLVRLTPGANGEALRYHRKGSTVPAGQVLYEAGISAVA